MTAVFVLCVTRHAWAERNEGKTEITPVPLVGGTTDIGFGGGALVSLARTRPDAEPYLYRLELSGLMTFRKEADSFEVPFQDYYLKLHLPQLRNDALDMLIRLSYTREATLKYYGVGNDTRIPAGRSLQSDYFEFDRIHPKAQVITEHRIAGPFSVELGVRYSHNWIRIPKDSKLLDDQTSPDQVVRDLVGTLTTHNVATFSYGLALDTRDNEVDTRSGNYHQVRFDWSPGGAMSFPYHWARANASLRTYVTLTPARSTLALRAVSDFLFGDPPVYELARYDDTSAFGGPNGVRGIPAQRYNGMIKAFGNIELRTRFFDFHFLGKKNTFGTVVFFDAGRLWATYGSHPALDGTGVGLKYGVGAGPRLMAGKSFVLRVDVAWSKDAEPIAAYFQSGHVF